MATSTIATEDLPKYISAFIVQYSAIDAYLTVGLCTGRSLHWFIEVGCWVLR